MKVLKRKSGPGGFTLVETLVVISIIALLSSMIFSAVQGIRAKMRDSERKSRMLLGALGLKLYYDQYGYYPSAAGQSRYQFSYAQDNCSSSISGLRFDNSASLGAWPIGEECNSYLMPSCENWQDPLKPTIGATRYNCRYVTKCTGTDSSDSATCNAQSFLLHCAFESDRNTSENDGGNQPILYEFEEPQGWICVTGIPSI